MITIRSFVSIRLGLLIILLLAVFTRLYNLENNPPALYWDETSIGYNAFTILKSGVDEHGVRYPLTHFLAYGDAKPPLYIYLVSLSMAVVGVSDVAVRLPSAISGVIAVGLLYVVGSSLAKEWRSMKAQTGTPTLFGLAIAGLVAISPWHIHLSRAGFEANLALTLFLLGVCCLWWAKQRPWTLLVAAVCFVATWYTFNAYRIFLPVFLPVLGWYFFPSIKKHWRYSLAAVGLATILALPLLQFVLSPQASVRFNEVSIFNDLQPVVEANLRQELNGMSRWSKILHNRRVYYALEFIDGLVDHLKPGYLFVVGDANPRLSPQDMGILYLIELPLMIIGVLWLLTHPWRGKWLILSWLLLGLVPAAIARETPHALRSLQALPAIYLLVGCGFIFVWRRLTDVKTMRYRMLSEIHWMYGLIGLYLLAFGWYSYYYHRYYPVYWAGSWQYGYKQLVEYLAQVADEYQYILVTQSVGRPATYVLYYQQILPDSYLPTRVVYSDPLGFVETKSFGTYYFDTLPDTVTPGDRVLRVGAGNTDVAPERVRRIITNPLGERVFVVYE